MRLTDRLPIFTLLLLVASAAPQCLSRCPAVAADFYVSPNGADTNSGTRAAPLATLVEARDRIREAGIAGKEPVTVHLLDGVYCFPSTFMLTSADSGSAAAPVVYRAAHEGKAVISGAIVLKDLSWRPHRGGIVQTTLPTSLFEQSELDELWIDDEKLDMARYPNRNESAAVFDGATDWKTLNQRARSYGRPDTGHVHALHRHRWGSVHYRVLGVVGGVLQLSGGWQQNRERALNHDAVMIENILEELDHPGEWFFDAESRSLYVHPPANRSLDGSTLYGVDLQELIHFRGSQAAPVRHIHIRGIEFRHARRVCLAGEDQWEGLLRGDWAIHRSGAVLLEGTEHCSLRDCFFNQTGGNGVFFNRYNRQSEVVDSRFQRLGESAVCFVGSYQCTRSNPIGYENSYRYDEMDVVPGPKGSDYPRHCRMEGCLVFAIGRWGKQTAGAFISMAENITLRHNTIYHVPRSAITINDGCWGGHLLEGNDVFDTVIETGDHGPFNSWGRDRYWVTRHHGVKQYRQPTVSQHGESIPQEAARQRARLDSRTPTVIRNNRWWHGDSHTWGIDLDDGSSNYEIYNNLCLGCSVKLREGFYRRVENNILIGNEGIQIHVPFDHSGDTIAHNIVVLEAPAAYLYRQTPVEKMRDARQIDYNLFWSLAQWFDPSLDNEELRRFQGAGIDKHSLSADPRFVDPLHLDFRLRDDSPALKLGFQPFPLDGFGVTKPSLKVLAERGRRQHNTFRAEDYWGEQAKSRIAAAVGTRKNRRGRVHDFLGARVKDLDTEQEKSTAGVGEMKGVFVLEVPAGCAASDAGLSAGEAIVAVDGEAIGTANQLLKQTRDRRRFRLRVIGATEREIEVTRR